MTDEYHAEKISKPLTLYHSLLAKRTLVTFMVLRNEGEMFSRIPEMVD